MIYEVDNMDKELDWKAKGTDRIIQNIKNLVSTFRYEVSYDRTKGIDPSILDMSSDQAMALYTSEIYRLIETYEPRATIVSVTPLNITPGGDLQVKVVIDI